MRLREELFKELHEFLLAYAESVARVFGDALPMPSTIDPTASRLWRTIAMAYEYGVEGVRTSHFLGVEGVALDPDISDADAFFHALSTDHMQSFLGEDNAGFPATCARVVNTAIARHVLDGGVRDLLWDLDLYAESGYLTIGEVALLAGMDERSVRNAAASKSLVTQQIGKRTLVQITDANRWLAGRKGFVYSKGSPKSLPDPIAVSADTLKALADRATEVGMSLDDFVRQRLLAF